MAVRPPKPETDPVATAAVAAEASRAQAAEAGKASTTGNPDDDAFAIGKGTGRSLSVVSSSHGLLADLPDLTSVTEGSFYWADDDNGGTLYQLQSGVWVMVGPRSVELNYAQIIASQGPITTEAPIAGLDAFTVTFRGRPVMVHARMANAKMDTSGGSVQVFLRDITGVAWSNAAPLKDFDGFKAAAANDTKTLQLWARIPAQAPGTQKTYAVSAANFGGIGTATIQATASVPAFIEAEDR